MTRAVMDAYRRALAKAACKVARLRHGEDGQGTTEYAILVGVLDAPTTAIDAGRNRESSEPLTVSVAMFASQRPRMPRR